MTAQQAYDELQYDIASRRLQRALEHAKNCKEDLARIYELKAKIDAIND